MTDSTPRHYFDTLYGDDDPYGYRDRWYEQRKRSLLLASLASARFADAWEVGCSNGESTAALAARCDQLLATDFSPRAVALTRARTQGMANVRVLQAHHPADWPDGSFDLIVFSEIGYFLSRADLATTCARLRGSLRDDGLLVACHWLLPFAAAPLSGRDVHLALQAGLGLPGIFHYEDQDFLLDGWSRNGMSLAAREGLR